MSAQIEGWSDDDVVRHVLVVGEGGGEIRGSALARVGARIDVVAREALLDAIVAHQPALVVAVGDAARDDGEEIVRALAPRLATALVPIALLGPGHDPHAVPQAAADRASLAGSSVDRELEAGRSAIASHGGAPSELVRTAIASHGAAPSALEGVRTAIASHGGAPSAIASNGGAPSELEGVRVAIVSRGGAPSEIEGALRAHGAHVVIVGEQGDGLVAARVVAPDVVLVSADALHGWGRPLLARMARSERLRWAALVVAPEGSPDALAALAAAFAPDRAIRARASDATDVASGIDVALELVGPVRLLRAVSSSESPLRVEVARAGSVVCVDLAPGLVVGATARAAGGPVIAGPGALAVVLAMPGGRVRVRPGVERPPANLMEPLEEAIASADQATPAVAFAPPPQLRLARRAAAPPPASTPAPVPRVHDDGDDDPGEGTPTREIVIPIDARARRSRPPPAVRVAPVIEVTETPLPPPLGIATTKATSTYDAILPGIGAAPPPELLDRLRRSEPPAALEPTRADDGEPELEIVVEVDAAPPPGPAARPPSLHREGDR